jgi:membrane-bound ClpP family serine protease
MASAIAVLGHPIGAYACLMTALAASVYAWHTRRSVAALTAVAAAALTGLACLVAPPDVAGVALVVLGIALLQTELMVPTYGAALVTGCAAAIVGAWRLLGATTSAAPVLPAALRLALAIAGTLMLLAAVLRAFRLRTLGARCRR